MTADLFLANIGQGASMIGALLAIAGVGWVYRLSSRRHSDRRDEG